MKLALDCMRLERVQSKSPVGSRAVGSGKRQAWVAEIERHVRFPVDEGVGSRTIEEKEHG